jgi:hypothetical protein
MVGLGFKLFDGMFIIRMLEIYDEKCFVYMRKYWAENFLEVFEVY